MWLPFPLLAAILVARVGAAPAPIFGRPPEDIICTSDSIYGHANYDGVVVEEADNWFQVDVNSPNLDECIRRCYGYRFCFSVTYDHTRDKPCIFYLHTRDDCKGTELVDISSIKYTNSPVSVSCLKCGDLVVKEKEKIDKPQHKPEIEFSKDEEIETVSTDSETSVAHSRDDTHKESAVEEKPSTAAAAYGQSCVVTFEVFADDDVNAYPTERVASVTRIEECAYICYQNSCSGAIFVPATSSEEKAKCKVRMSGEEKCDVKNQRHYFYKPTHSVVLSCFRCQPERPSTISPDARYITATTTPSPHLVEHKFTSQAPAAQKPAAETEKIDKGAKTPVEAPEGPESAEKPESNGEKTVPAAQPPAEAPQTPTSTSAPTTAAPTTPATPTKPASASTEAPKSAQTPAASASNDDNTVSLGKARSGPILVSGGCLITFQADFLSARPDKFTSEFELVLNTETPEICAMRCFQDGCTGALFSPENGTCILGYNDEQYCNKRPTISYLLLEESDKQIWIHCAGCKSEKFGSVEPVTGNMKNDSTEAYKKAHSEHQLKPKGNAVGAGGEEAATPGPVKITEPVTTPPATTKAAETPNAAPEDATESTKPSEATTETAKPSGDATEATKPSESPESTASPEAAAKTTLTPAAATTTSESATTAKSGSKPASTDSSEFTQGCLITFQAGDISDRPPKFTSKFELPLQTVTPEVCATRCYQDGCTGAMFFFNNGTCLLGYDDEQFCDHSPILRFYKPKDGVSKDSLWIHCTVCRSPKHGETFVAEAEEKPPSKKP